MFYSYKNEYVKNLAFFQFHNANSVLKYLML